VIGLEIGQALHRLGVRVKIFGRGGGVGPLSDPALLESARRIFGAELYLDTSAHAEVARHGDLIAVKYRALDGSTANETFDYLLAATGRRPNLSGLGLARTSLALDAHGVPLFDRRTLQCGRSSIFISGDVNNVRPGLRRAGIAIVFTDPQIAIIGGGWRDVQPIPHIVGEVSFHNQGRSRVMLRNKGLLHVYAAIEDGAFLGAEMLGPDAEHIGHLLAWALQMKLTVQQMLDMPFYHPVIEEGVRSALRDARAKLAAAQAERRAA
jgi:dihydrolipoamide dehydrogenase